MAVKEEEIPEGFKKLREKFPSGIQYWPSNYPRLEDGEWRNVGQYTEFPDELKDFIRDKANLFGHLDTVRRIGILYNFQVWDYGRFTKPDESLEDRGLGLIYMMSTKRVFCLTLFSDWLDVLGMTKPKEVIDDAYKMKEFEEFAYKDSRFALLVKYLMEFDHRNILGSPLKRSLEARFFVLDLLKPGVISEQDFQEMKKEYGPKLSASQAIDMTDMLDIIIFFDHLDDFQLTQLRSALLRAKKDDLIPRLDKFMKDNEAKLKEINLY